jgi:hypothetical protein
VSHATAACGKKDHRAAKNIPWMFPGLLIFATLLRMLFPARCVVDYLAILVALTLGTRVATGKW